MGTSASLMFFPFKPPQSSEISPELQGGPELQEARKQLPVLNEYGDRIPTGEALRGGRTNAPRGVQLVLGFMGSSW